MVPDEASGGAVEEIGAGGADFAVGAGDLRLSFGAVRGPLLAAGQPPLVVGQVPGPAFQVPGVGDPLPVAGDREVGDPQVNADGLPVAGACSGSGMSTANATYQRPHGSRDTVTVDGLIEAESIPGHDQMNASGVPIFARYRRPARYRNPDRVYSADCRPCRDLNRGYRARPAKNAVYAACWWRIACWSGTADTSFSQVSSSVAFRAVR